MTDTNTGIAKQEQSVERSKKRTSKSIGGELHRKREKIRVLTEQCAALEKEYEAVYKDELQKTLHDVMLKGKRLTHTQMLKAIELGMKVKDSLDGMDVEEAAQAIASLSASHSETPPVDEAAKPSENANTPKDDFSFSLESQNAGVINGTEPPVEPKNS